MNTKKVVIPVVISAVVLLGVIVYIFMYQSPDKDDFDATNPYSNSAQDTNTANNNTQPINNIINDVTPKEEAPKSPYFTAQIPESWILLDTLGTEIIAASNYDETIQFSIIRYPRELDENAKPEDTVKLIFDKAGEPTSSHLNFVVLQEPAPLKFKNYLAAQGVNNSDIKLSDTKSINVTGRVIYVITDSNEYQIIFDVESKEFEQQTEIFNQFLESLELF